FLFFLENTCFKSNMRDFFYPPAPAIFIFQGNFRHFCFRQFAQPSFFPMETPLSLLSCPSGCTRRLLFPPTAGTIRAAGTLAPSIRKRI
ncbi:MAG: hypothetical protein PUH00_07960, partial [Clostridiales bacterium]|nr:hypothetical protein [Clostridiales bacterium]